MTNVFNGLTDEGAAMTNVFDGLTDEQEFIVQALRRLMQPLLNEKIPSCCPFSITGLLRTIQSFTVKWPHITIGQRTLCTSTSMWRPGFLAMVPFEVIKVSVIMQQL